MTTYHPYEMEFHTPPEYQGQIVTYSYGYDPDAEVIIERCHDASDGRVIYTAYANPEDDDGTWEPWNGAPELGDEIGPCAVED